MFKEMGSMFAWFEEEGFGTNILALRNRMPELQDFRSWLQETSSVPKR